MTDKPKVAFYWCASCGGCEEAVVDLAEELLGVAAAVDIVFWPVALDFKRADVEAMEDGEILATFVNGAIRTTEQEEMVHLLRKKSKVLVAFGACAQLGGIPGLANLWDREAIFERAYLTSPTTENPAGTVPLTDYAANGHRIQLPGFYDTVMSLDQVTQVDYAVPGCAPTPNLIAAAVGALLSGDLPPLGTVLAPDVALCSECDRRDTKPEDLHITAFKRPHEIIADDETCLLAQGLLCLGPATRAGCGAQCIGANMPCTGCFGPTSRVHDQGAKAASAIASLVGADDPAEIERILDGIPDPIGTFYRYGLPHSLMVRRRQDTVETTA
ncbi:MAG: oxidoreductase [Actinobacteria bacterium]|nr:oxidoreductase [Actinomycetota bacterium]MBU1494516.1 oxidoreductase [Actinomycetota bacterium]